MLTPSRDCRCLFPSSQMAQMSHVNHYPTNTHDHSMLVTQWNTVCYNGQIISPWGQMLKIRCAVRMISILRTSRAGEKPSTVSPLCSSRPPQWTPPAAMICLGRAFFCIQEEGEDRHKAPPPPSKNWYNTQEIEESHFQRPTLPIY